MTTLSMQQTEFDASAYDEQLRLLAELSHIAVRKYELPAGCDVDLINLSENATYKVEHPATGRRWALRLHRDGYHTDTAIRSELAWQRDLREKQIITTPAALPGLDGEIL
ncbi:MAG: aminoglycoside phosphotransferase, partial [Pseudomonadota bacterium]